MAIDKPASPAGEADRVISDLARKISKLPNSYRLPIEADLSRLIDIFQDQNRRASDQQMIEQELRESENRFQVLANSTPLPIFVTDVTGGNIFVNRAYREFLGVNFSEVKEDLWQGFLHPDDGPGYIDAFMQAVHDQMPFKGEVRALRSDGDWRWLVIYAEPHFAVNGAYLGHVGNSMDITERKRAEQAVRESEQIYRAIGETIDYGVWICDPEGRNLYASDSFLQLLGITQEQCSDFGWADLLHPDDVEITTRSWKEFVQDETGATWDIEHRFRGKDGQYHPILARGVPVRNEQGEVVCWAGINLDISRLKDTENALRESEQKFQSIFQNAPFPIVLLDAGNSRVVDINNRFLELFDFQKDEVVGRTAVELGVVPDPAARAEIFQEILQMGFVRNRELDYRTRNDDSLIVLMNADRITIGGKEFILTAVENITERKRAENSLRSSEAHLRESEAMLREKAAALQRSAMNERARANELEALMDAVPAMIWVSHDPECREMIGNRAGYELLLEGPESNLSSTAPQEVLARQKYHNMKDGRPIPPAELPMQVAASTGQPARNYTYDIVFDDGTTYNVIGNVNPLFDAEGRPAGAVGAFVDITALRRLQAEQMEARTEIEVQRWLMEQRELERQQIARDIHDGPIQTLVGTIFNLQTAKEALPDRQLQVELNQIGLSIKSAVQELRQVVNELRPPSILLLGFSRAIQIHAEDFREKHPELDLQVDLAVDPHKFSDQTSLTLFRIYQEGLNNIIRHAEATSALVRLYFKGERGIMEIKDNGKGFEVTTSLAGQTKKRHYGIAGMKERAEALDGKLEIHSGPGKGTTIRLVFPVDQQEQGNGPIN